MKNSRYEIKFVLSNPQVSQALEWIYFHTSAKLAHPNRLVNSIYFDENDFTSVKDNLIGLSNRSKYRLRWYGDSRQNEEVDLNFEIKNRSNRTGDKTRKAIEFNDSLLRMSYGEIELALKEKLSPEIVFKKSLSPALQVCYLRKYLEGSNNIRITLDSGIRYFSTSNNTKIFSSKPIRYPMTIMEIKFNPELLNTVSSSLRDFHLLPKRHSKYLTGISMLGNAVYI
jgi:SPX domain protein involved in polyphosphate accumulation